MFYVVISFNLPPTVECKCSAGLKCTCAH